MRGGPALDRADCVVGCRGPPCSLSATVCQAGMCRWRVTETPYCPPPNLQPLDSAALPPPGTIRVNPPAGAAFLFRDIDPSTAIYD